VATVARNPSSSSAGSRAGRLARRSALPAVLVVAILTVTALWMLGRRAAAEKEAADEPLRVDVIRAERVDAYTVTRRYTGSVQARRRSLVGFELGGQLGWLLFDDGDRVHRGQALARIDTERLEARRRELSAAAAQAEAQARLARGRFDRVSRAFEEGAASIEELDVRKDELAVAEAAAQQAREAVRAIEVDISKATLHAPFDAVVRRRLRDEGDVVAAGVPIFELLEDAQPEARVGLPARAAASIDPGQVVDVFIGETRISGALVATLPVTERGTRTVEAVIELDTSFRSIRDGDLASVELERAIDTPGFWLDLGALTSSARGLWSCMIAAEEGSDGSRLFAASRQLEVLYTHGDRAFVTGTLEDGDRVIASGLHRLVPGDPVVPVPAGEGDASSSLPDGTPG